ncbi:hypothetical protein GUJ93_ZPchr0011g27360 [Zizania palustris]|uniref:Uncharacterized protein n=1 Tax=Zizania palustris TaxID=103762 RepID=A0A8J6BSQ6_ZIZPA|nr:hypothetical protein GUJ93_ZPchr0011g28860 [Zizania palustris]KAG8089548.1 hypothetical protein GUJ93_ZPchr0011g27360 [Zizania palustris]
MGGGRIGWAGRGCSGAPSSCSRRWRPASMSLAALDDELSVAGPGQREDGGRALGRRRRGAGEVGGGGEGTWGGGRRVAGEVRGGRGGRRVRWGTIRRDA